MEVELLQDQFNNHNYTFVKNFLDKDSCQSLTDYAFFLKEQNKTVRDGNRNTNNISDCFNIGAPYNRLLVKILPTIELITKKNLLPTYFYARIYLPGEALYYHTDRESCEYSVTINLATGSEYKWPIFFDTPEGTVEYITEPGDAVIYKGRDIPHWRNKFEGEWQLQVFFHYVDMFGSQREWVWDKRTFNEIDL